MSYPSQRQLLVRHRAVRGSQWNAWNKPVSWKPCAIPNIWPTADRLALGLAYFRLGIPCPFLDSESC